MRDVLPRCWPEGGAAACPGVREASGSKATLADSQRGGRDSTTGAESHPASNSREEPGSRLLDETAVMTP